MSKFRISTALAAIVIVSSSPFALAQTTLGGNAKDNSASGGRENGTAAGSGKGMTGSGASTAAPAVATTTENKPTASGGQPGGDATRGK